MASPAPIFARERTAAQLLDMKPSEFRELVDAGILPPPESLGDFERWRVSLLVAINTGAAFDEDFEP